MTKEIYDEIPKDDLHRFLLWQYGYNDTQNWARWFERKGVPYTVDTDGNGMWTLYKHMPYGEDAQHRCDCLQKKGITDLVEVGLVEIPA